MDPSETPTPPERVEMKTVKHVFTSAERDQMGGDLARCIGTLRGIEAEFDKIKASFKARTAEAEARIDTLSTDVVNGFVMRDTKCIVRYRYKDRKKDYYVEEGFDLKTSPIVLTEDMTQQDFQCELMQAESKFDTKEEIALFDPTETDYGHLVVGRFAGKWFTALRIKIGKVELNERLDSEQKCFKGRPDAVKTAVKRAAEWLKVQLKDHAKGFESGLDAVVDAHKERAE